MAGRGMTRHPRYGAATGVLITILLAVLTLGAIYEYIQAVNQ